MAGLLLSLIGCSSENPRSETPFLPSDTITSAVDRDSAVAALSALNRTAFDSAFANLDDVGVTRYVRTEQLTPSGTITAVQSYVVRHRPASTPQSGVVLRRDSIGTFRAGGVFGGAAPDQNLAGRPDNIVEQVLPDQPPYIEPRTREAFRYALRPDSLETGTPIHVIEARARTHGTGRDQDVRFARLMLHRPSYELIGLDLVRDDDVLLFGETSRTSIRLRQAPWEGDAWLPSLIRVRSSLDIPFRTVRQHRVVSAFYKYRP